MAKNGTKIIEKRLQDLTPYEKNPRKNAQAVDAVAASIREFGFKVPIVIDRDGVIVAGHTRYKAAGTLNMDKVPCIVADDLTDEQIRAFRLADNKSAELAEWDFDLLPEQLAAIQEIDMSVFGFEDIEEEIVEEMDEDDFDEESASEHGIQVGQVWVCGSHRVMCGDSTRKEDADKLMGGCRRAWSSPIHHTECRSKIKTSFY